jgi:GAF domain-containing protein
MTTSPKIASVEKKTQLLIAASKAAKNFSSILDFEELLEQTVNIICDEFGFYYAGVFLADADLKWANLAAGRGEAGKAMLDEGHRLKIGGNSMIGDCIAKKQARISLDVGDEAVFFKNPHLPETRSEMGLPLVFGGKAIGALTVQSRKEAAFTQEDIAALQTMADQLAVAIQNSRYYQLEQKRSKYLEAANRVGKNLTMILELEHLLPKTVDIICDEYDFYYAGVFLIDFANEWAVLKAGRGEAGQEMIKANHKLKIGGNSMIGNCIKTKEARISLDVGEEDVFYKNPYLPKTKSEMALPLVVGKEVLGAVTVQSEQEKAFTDEDISTLQTMADLLAVAIKNAYTMKQLEEAHLEILQQKTFEALATSTTQAIHWIGNKALPITTTARRIKGDIDAKLFDLESLKEDVDLIIEAADTIVEVKEKLIGQAREHAPRPLNLPDLVETAITELGDNFVNFSIAFGREIETIIGDSTQLVQGFMNLFINSIEANANHIGIEISTNKLNNSAIVKISDDGDGIPTNTLENIWASFFTTKGANRHGLGLPSTLHIVSQHRGTIAVDSTEGEGTAFTLSFPIGRIPAYKIAPINTKNVYLVSEQSYYSKWCEDLFNANQLELEIVTDFNKPGKKSIYLINGDQKDLFNLLKSTPPKKASKFFVISNFLTVEKTTKLLALGADDVLLKPHSSREMDELLKSLGLQTKR